MLILLLQIRFILCLIFTLDIILFFREDKPVSTRSFTSGGSRISRRGGVDLVGGPWTPEAATFLKFLHVKTKRIWTRRGGARRARPLDPANVHLNNLMIYLDTKPHLHLCM